MHECARPGPTQVAPLPFPPPPRAGTHVSLLQKRQHLGDVVQSENTVRRLLESMQLKEKNRTVRGQQGWTLVAGAKETHQFGARELLQQGHEYVAILYFLEKVVHLDGRGALRHRRKRTFELVVQA